MKRFVSFLSTITLALSFFAATPAFAAGEGSIKLSPATGSYTKDATFQVQVRYGTGTQATVGVNAVLTYNPSLLSTSTGAVTINTADLNLAPPVIVDSTTGKVEVGAAKTGTTGTVQSDALLATITFTAKAAGSATVGISQAQSAVNIYDSASGNTQNVLGTVTGATYTITGGTGGGSDTTAPTISSEASSSISQNTAKITWTTNEATTGKVDYGTTTSYGSSSSVTTSGTSHSVTLTGLSAGTKYYYRITATDGSSNSASGQALSFTTSTASTGGTGGSGGTGSTGGTGGTGGTDTTETPLTAPVTGAGQWIAIAVAVAVGVLAVVIYALYAVKRDKKKAAAGDLQSPTGSASWQ